MKLLSNLGSVWESSPWNRSLLKCTKDPVYDKTVWETPRLVVPQSHSQNPFQTQLIYSNSSLNHKHHILMSDTNIDDRLGPIPVDPGHH